MTKHGGNAHILHWAQIVDIARLYTGSDYPVTLNYLEDYMLLALPQKGCGQNIM